MNSYREQRVIVIGATLGAAADEARWYTNVVAIASSRSLHRLHGVVADRIVYAGGRVSRSEAAAIAAAVNPCVATTDCGHEALSGLEGPLDDLGRWAEVWACDGCGRISIDSTAGAQL
jgi:hypothetical protein